MQAQYSPERTEAYAFALATKYDLNVSIEEARALLKQG